MKLLLIKGRALWEFQQVTLMPGKSLEICVPQLTRSEINRDVDLAGLLELLKLSQIGSAFLQKVSSHKFCPLNISSHAIRQAMDATEDLLAKLGNICMIMESLLTAAFLIPQVEDRLELAHLLVLMAKK